MLRVRQGGPYVTRTAGPTGTPSAPSCRRGAARRARHGGPYVTRTAGPTGSPSVPLCLRGTPPLSLRQPMKPDRLDQLVEQTRSTTPRGGAGGGRRGGG